MWIVEIHYIVFKPEFKVSHSFKTQMNNNNHHLHEGLHLGRPLLCALFHNSLQLYLLFLSLQILNMVNSVIQNLNEWISKLNISILTTFQLFWTFTN